MVEFKTTVLVIKSLVGFLGPLMKGSEKRRTARFDELIKPLHESFQEVHVDYTTMLRTFMRGLPQRQNNGQIEKAEGFEAIDEMESVAIVRKLKDDFEAARKEREYVRDWLRTNAQALLLALDEPAERRYLYVLMVYFLSDDHHPCQDDHSLDSFIDEVIKKGGNTAMNTPTSKLSKEIRGRVDCEEVRLAIETALVDLNQRCSDVIGAFVALKLSVISQSSA